MKIFKYFIFGLIIITLSSCAGLTIEETKPWLNSMAGTSTVTMTGVWDSGGAIAGGWGEGRFTQTGNRISGTLGFYNVDGAVNGADVYLVLLSGGNVFYTAHLKQSNDGSYMGKAVEKAIVDGKGSESAVSYLMVLKKVSNVPWLTREATNSWLNSMAGVPGVTMTGVWDSGGAVTGGWGEGRFIQTGNRVSGTLGFYSIDGAVNGTDVYLVLYSRVKVYHTAHLKQSKDGNYIGKVVERAILDKKGLENAVSYPIVLKKVSNN